MQNPKEVFEITKKKFGLRFDRELADLLGITKSTLSQRISRLDYPFDKIRQICASQNLDHSWLDQYEEEMMNRDSTKILNQESVRLRDKEDLINMQKKYIDRLEREIDDLREERKKKWIPENAPEFINQPYI